MSETPRTDEQAIRIMFGNLDTVVPVEFARQRDAYKKALEIAEDELMTARAEIERLKCCGNCEYCNQRIEVCEHPDNEPEDVMKGRCEHWQHDAEAAERSE